MIGQGTNADIPHTPVRYALAYGLIAIMFAASASLLFCPTSGRFVRFIWDPPVSRSQIAITRAVGALGVAMTVGIAIAMTVEILA